MSTTPAQIDNWRSVVSEHQQLEFKEAKNQYDNKKLYQYCVAIANEGGGHLLLGIEDKPPRKVIGTSAFNNLVEMAEKLFQNLGFRVDIEEVQHPDGRVLVFHIPSRPKGTVYNLEGAYLMRSGEELVPMSEDQLRKIFAEGEPDWLEEPTLQSLNIQQVIELLDTQTFFELIKLPYPGDQKGVMDRLQQERLIDKLGVFLFGGLALFYWQKDYLIFRILYVKYRELLFILEIRSSISLVQRVRCWFPRVGTICDVATPSKRSGRGRATNRNQTGA